jgi:cysteinyl-tRNA synthetase
MIGLGGLEAAAAREAPGLPPEVRALADERQAARERRDWAAADALRDRIAAMGYAVTDTPEGPRLEPA